MSRTHIYKYKTIIHKER